MIRILIAEALESCLFWANQLTNYKYFPILLSKDNYTIFKMESVSNRLLKLHLPMELMYWKSNSTYNRDTTYIYNEPEIAFVLVL